MKWCLLALIAFLFTSCATVGAVYTASTYLSIDIPKYGKGFAIRKNGEKYILSYRYWFSDTAAASLGPANYGYEISYATMGKREIDRLCGRDSMPTLLQQRLTIQSGYSPKFEAGTPVGFGSLGCTDNPLFKIVDSEKFKKPAKIGLLASAAAADATLFYLYPLVYAGVVLTGTVVGLIAALVLSTSLH